MRVAFIDPGSLRSELILEAPVTAPDGIGGFVQSWTEIAVVFARIEPLSAERKFSADKMQEAVSHRVIIRARDGIAAGMRLRRQDRVFDIVTVHDPDETSRYLVCKAREVVQ